MSPGEKLQKYLRAVDRVIDASPHAQAEELEHAQLRLAASFRDMRRKTANADKRFVTDHKRVSELLSKAVTIEPLRARSSWRSKLLGKRYL